MSVRILDMSSLRWSGEQSGRAQVERGAELRVRLWAAPALGSSWRCAQLEGGIEVGRLPAAG